MERKLNIFTDGASRGNPGNAGIGFLIIENKKTIIKHSEFIGKNTNNEAEYIAVIKALEKINLLFNKEILNKIQINLFSDSEFLVKQIKGEYKVKSIKIKPLFDQILALKKNLNLTFNWIPRTENSIADELANKGIDERNKTHNITNNTNTNNNNNPLINNNKNNLTNNNQQPKLLIEKAFFGKINCFKLQMNQNKEVYFHIGLLKNNNWEWIKVKMNDSELGEIIHNLEKDESKCAFYHNYNNNKTQIWCNKNLDRFTIKIDKISKNFTIGEYNVLKILLKECIIKMNF